LRKSKETVATAL